MIHFKLIDFDKIVPTGQSPELHLSWFWLTDGDLWLTLGNETIYEYSEEAMAYFEDKPTPYSDYYIVRFLEDFTGIFEKVSASIPKKFYSLTFDLEQFNKNAQKWLDLYDTDDDEHSEFYFEEYDKLISWVYQRTFDSGHLIGGPHLSFFRHYDKIRIVWDTEHTLENGISLWTAKDGSCEMDFSSFVYQVKMFGDTFFRAMDKQIELVLAKDWGDIKIDKPRLVEEHKERKLQFEKNLAFLEHGADDENGWTEIEELYNRMICEIK
nr:DUF5984 family protein [uncultured Flavobacterium sp.]